MEATFLLRRLNQLPLKIRYKLKITNPNKANNIFTRLLVFGTSVSLIKLVSGFLSSNEIATAATIKTTKM